MSDVIIIWDLPEDPDGNVQHIAAHDITIDEAEEVLLDGNRANITVVSPVFETMSQMLSLPPGT